MKITELELIASVCDDYEYDTMSSNEGMWCLDVYKYDKAPHGTIAFYSDDNIRYGLTFDYTFDDVTKLLQVMQEMKEKDDYHDVQFPFDEHGIDLDDFEWVPMPARCKGRHINAEEVEEVKVEELKEIAMKTMTIANQNKIAAAINNVTAKAEEEKAMKKNNRYVVAMVIGSVVNMTQINAVKTWLTKNAKASVDIIVSGNPIRVQKLGCVINELKTPIRMIGCGVKNNDIFAYTHQDEHPCVWAINHSDVVFTIGDGMVVTEAKKYAFKTNRSYYSYGRQFVESICKGHYDKAVITRADIVTTNEAKAIKAEEVKVVAKPKVDLIAVAKAEMDAAKKVYDAAKAKYDKLVAESKPVAKKEVVGRGKELFVDVELSSNMGDITKSFTEEQKKAEEEAVDEVVEAFMAKEESMAEPVKADFTFEGKGYNVIVKEAFDVELFNSCDAETQKMVIEESMAAGHIVAA